MIAKANKMIANDFLMQIAMFLFWFQWGRWRQRRRRRYCLRRRKWLWCNAVMAFCSWLFIIVCRPSFMLFMTHGWRNGDRNSIIIIFGSYSVIDKNNNMYTKTTKNCYIIKVQLIQILDGGSNIYCISKVCRYTATQKFAYFWVKKYAT